MADRRFIDPEGEEWASEFEYQVYEGLRILGYAVRKCGKGDSFTYTSAVIGGRCLECSSGRVRQERSYTPDLYVSDLPTETGPEGYYVEAKGYWNAHKRNLLRSAVRENKDLNPLFVFQSDKRATPKLTYTQYAAKYFPGSRVAIYPWYRGLKKQSTLDEKLAQFQASILRFSGSGEK